MTRRAAFTLVEMMVALAVTGVLTIMMLRMFNDSSTIWKSEDDRLDTFREARSALQLMSRELATALPMPDVVMPGTKPTDPMVEFPVLALRDHQTRSITGLPTNYYKSVYALASTPNSGRSDLCALGYMLVWEPDIDTTQAPAGTQPPPARSCFVLRRQLAQSDTTFALLKTTLSANSPVFGESAFSKLYATKAPTGSTDPVTETIASYIWDLQIAVAPSPISTAPTTTTTPAAPAKNVFYGRELPEWVEIRFKALGANAARKLSGRTIDKELWDKPDDPIYQRLITPQEQQFVSRVKLAR